MVIDNPHDKFLKIAVQVGQVVAGILEFQLSLSALKELDLSSSELQSGSFVNENFKEFDSDAVLKSKGKNGDTYLYFLLEHQSTSDPLIVPRLWQYMSNIIAYDIKRQLSIDPNRNNLKVPAIYPFVLYSGKAKYKWPKKFSIEIDGCPLLDLSSYLVELREYSLADLLKSKKAALLLFLLKESWKKDFCKVLRDNPQLSELINSSSYAESAILYMIDQDPHKDQVVEEIRNLNQNIKKNVMGNLMEIEQRGEQRGFKLGEQIGEQRGFKDAIVKLLAHGMDKAKAAEVLG